MRTFYFNSNVRWVVFILLSLLPIILVLQAVTRNISSSSSDESMSNDRIRQLEDAIIELQKQLSEEKDLEIDLMSTLKKYKDVVVKRGQGEDAAMPDEKFLDCRDIDKIKITQQIAKGYSKLVQEGVLANRHLAVKSASYDVKTIKECVQGGMYKKKEDCYILGTYQVLKEAMMLKQLHHPNIIRLLGLCVRSENSSPLIQERGVTVIEELGLPVHLHELTGMEFKSKVQICLDMARLLLYLTTTPMGSVAITDWRDEQFVFVGGKIKLADVDGLNSREPSCDKDMKCLIDNIPSRIKCAKNMECPGTNALTNLNNAMVHFFGPLLGTNINIRIFSKTSAILQKLQANELDAEDLVDRLEELVQLEAAMTDAPPKPQVVDQFEAYRR